MTKRLPIIKAPTTDIKLFSIDKPVTIRPFTVQEEKLILMAAQGISSEDKMTAKQRREMTRTIGQVCTNCTFGAIAVDDLPTFDLDMMFIRLKQISSGQIVKIKHTCAGCNKENIIPVDYDRFEFEEHPDHTRDIELADGISVRMRYPSFALALSGIDEGDPASFYKVIKWCIESISQGDDVFIASQYSDKELDEFLNSLTTVHRDRIKQFFDTMPSVQYKMTYKCPGCGSEQQVIIEGTESFFA